MDVIDAVAQDWRPSTVNARAAVLDAVTTVAARNGGLVHIAWVRPLLPAWIDPHVPGAVFCELVRAEALEGTGTYLPNGNHRTRNRTKPSEVRRLTRPISQEAA